MPVSERTRARPSVSVTTPGFTRHLTFFFPARSVVPSLPEQVAPEHVDPLTPEPVKEQIVRYVASLLDLAEACGRHDRESRDVTISSLKTALDERSTFGIEYGDFLGLRLRLLITMYAEHFSLTYILDNEATDRTSGLSLASTVPSLQGLAEYLINALQTVSGQSDHDANMSLGEVIPLNRNYKFPERLGLVEDNQYWNDIAYRELWVAMDMALNNDKAIQLIGAHTLKSDVRGMVLTAPSSENDFVDDDIFAGIQRSRRPGAPSAALDARTPCIKAYLGDESAFLSATLQVGQSKHFRMPPQPEMDWDPNYVLCFINDKSAIYGSCLVYQDQETRDESELISKLSYNYVRYFMLYDGANNYTLGRLIRRIHVLADLRTLALIERQKITRMNECLRLIGNELSGIIDHMTGRWDGSIIQPEILNIPLLSKIVDSYNDLGKSNTTGSKKNLMFIKEHRLEYDRCYGGLSYRLNRSKYYYDLFTKRLEDLRCADIKSAQSYERFVVRNYYQQLQSIVSIGDRYAALGSRIDRAVTLAHGLQQRKFAQYAAHVAIVIASIPMFSAGLNFFNIALPDGLIKDSIALIYALVLVYCVLESLNWFNTFLKNRRLYVQVEKTNFHNLVWGKAVIGYLRRRLAEKQTQQRQANADPGAGDETMPR